MGNLLVKNAKLSDGSPIIYIALLLRFRSLFQLCTNSQERVFDKLLLAKAHRQESAIVFAVPSCRCLIEEVVTTCVVHVFLANARKRSEKTPHPSMSPLFPPLVGRSDTLQECTRLNQRAKDALEAI